MDVGFIGLGQMGQAMALNLVKAGHRVVVFNRTRAKSEALASEGAEIAESVADAAPPPRRSSPCSPDDDAVEAVFFGDGNGLSALGQGAVHISMSTISVALSDRLAEAHRNAGHSYVAAPVFGRPEAAAAAKLFVVAAGPEATLARCQPLSTRSANGPSSSATSRPAANLVKLSGNFLLAAMIECLGEALALVRKGGVDPHRYLEILTNTLFSAPAYKTYGTIIANEQYEPAGFKMSLGLKDVRLALAAADALATPMPVASLVHDHFLAGVAQGAADSDWSALARLAAAERRSLSESRTALFPGLVSRCLILAAAPITRKADRGASGLSETWRWGRFSSGSAVIGEVGRVADLAVDLAAIRGMRDGHAQAYCNHRRRMRRRFPGGSSRGEAGDGIRREAFTPRLNDVMVLTQFGHFKLWYAGAVQNWPLANYELEQIRASITLARDAFTAT